MHKLVTLLLASTALGGCMSDTKQEVDWTKGDGCEIYFSESSRELANCKAYVAAMEAKNNTTGMTPARTENETPGSVSLDKEGYKVKETQGMKENENWDKSELTN